MRWQKSLIPDFYLKNVSTSQLNEIYFYGNETQAEA